jgi:hypothetical protein
MMLLDLRKAEVKMFYTYKKIDTNGTEGTADDIEEEKNATFRFGLLSQLTQSTSIVGNAVNTFINDAYPTAVSDEIDSDQNASRIYMKGGSGIVTEIKLFSEDDAQGQEMIDQIKSDNWIINEANLVFYIDQEATEGIVEPPRLYLYNTEDNFPLISYGTERSEDGSSSLFGSFLNYDGIIEKSSDGKGVKYTVRITDYINDLVIREDSNVTLGLMLTPDITFVGYNSAMMLNDGERNLPVASTLTPLGTVLYGGASENGDKRLKLEIFYTQTN